jgi:hypothetical protein
MGISTTAIVACELLQPPWGSSHEREDGILRMMASGRWAVYRPGRLRVEITSGELFRVEVDGELKLTRMEYDEGYYSIDGYPLRDGLRAAIGEQGYLEVPAPFSKASRLSWSSCCRNLSAVHESGHRRDHSVCGACFRRRP